MTDYNPKPGDIVNFKNPSLKTSHRGVVVEYRPGRSINTGRKRDVLVKFNDPIWSGGPLEAWCALENLTLIWPTLRKANEVKPTVTYTSSSTTTTNQFDDYNIQIKKDNKLSQSTFSASDRPWTAYYVTADEFFDVLRLAFDEVYGGGAETPWHPEDMYVNVSTTLEIVANTLSSMANLKAGRPLKGIKEI
jgi:hypothetical protein